MKSDQKISCRVTPRRLPTSPRKAIEHLKSVDPKLGQAIERVGAMKLPGREPTLHALCAAIIGQQLSMIAARSIEQRFTATFGNGESLTPGILLEAPEEELRRVGLSRAKVIAVKGLAEFWQREGIDPETLRRTADEELIDLLTQVKGIGPWTVKMILIFCLRRPDVLPHEDLGFRAGLKKIYELEEVPKQPGILALTEEWRPWRTVGVWYCWEYLKIESE